MCGPDAVDGQTAAGQPPYQIGMTNTSRGTVLDDPVAVGPEQNELVSYSGDAITCTPTAAPTSTR